MVYPFEKSRFYKLKMWQKKLPITFLYFFLYLCRKRNALFILVSVSYAHQRIPRWAQNHFKLIIGIFLFHPHKSGISFQICHGPNVSLLIQCIFHIPHAVFAGHPLDIQNGSIGVILRILVRYLNPSALSAEPQQPYFILILYFFTVKIAITIITTATILLSSIKIPLFLSCFSTYKKMDKISILRM